MVRREREADFLQCEKFESCQQAKISSLEHFAKVADIQGFGPKVIGQCFDREYLRVPADFYQLEHADLASLERMGTKSADNLLAAVAERTTLDLPTFLQALGIQHLGRQYAELLADRYETLDATLAATREELVALHGVSELVATALLEDWRRARRSSRGCRHTSRSQLAARGLSELGEHPLRGKSALFTGTLEQCDRKSAQAMVTAVGGGRAQRERGARRARHRCGPGAKSSKQSRGPRRRASPSSSWGGRVPRSGGSGPHLERLRRATPRHRRRCPDPSRGEDRPREGTHEAGRGTHNAHVKRSQDPLTRPWVVVEDAMMRRGMKPPPPRQRTSPPQELPEAVVIDRAGQDTHDHREAGQRRRAPHPGDRWERHERERAEQTSRSPPRPCLDGSPRSHLAHVKILRGDVD